MSRVGESAARTTASAQTMASARAVLDLIRTGAAASRPALVERSGLGRTAADQRLAMLLGAGLVDDGDVGPSTGGRAPRRLRFRAEAGSLLVADIGVDAVVVARTDLSGTVLASRREPSDIAEGPGPVLARVVRLMRRVSADGAPAPLWGVGIGLPGPVEFVAARPVAPPIMPGWDGHPVGQQLARRLRAPVWVDNDANLLALGELRAGAARGVLDLVYVLLGAGIGAGLTSGGRIHRGAQGAAGDIGHIPVTDDPSARCACGRIGCLEAVVGGRALMARSGLPSMEALVGAATSGDAAALALLDECARRVGRVLATVVSIANPAVVALGGPLAAGPGVVEGIAAQVARGALPLATRELRVVRSGDPDLALRGAAFAVLDKLFDPAAMARWLPRGSPAGMTELAALHD